MVTQYDKQSRVIGEAHNFGYYSGFPKNTAQNRGLNQNTVTILQCLTHPPKT